MIIFGTVDEINNVIHYFNPKYPEIHAAQMRRNDYFYPLNGVSVEIIHALEPPTLNRKKGERLNGQRDI